MKHKISYISFLVLLVSTNSCIEEFNAATVEFEDTIVIEATITNELRRHVVYISRTYPLEEIVQIQESAAVVQIDTQNGSYHFGETEPGTYVSDNEFRAEPNESYTLSVTTADGRAYVSEPTLLTTDTPMDQIYAEKEINDDGIEGVGIFVDSFDPTGTSKYYGYEFEETYEIIAPIWAPEEFVITNLNPLSFHTEPRTQEERICYKAVSSTGRILTDTNLLNEDRISRFLVAFIPFNDIRVSSRYSISLRQYIQTLQAYNFHKVLDKFSSSESLLSQSQPGFFAGNIRSLNSTDEKVLGNFEVSTVSEQRLFISRSDFTNEDFDWECQTFLDSELEDALGGDFHTLLVNGLIEYVDGGLKPTDPYIVTPISCGDCTVLGSNVKPDFWID